MGGLRAHGQAEESAVPDPDIKAELQDEQPCVLPRRLGGLPVPELQSRRFP